MVKGVINGTTTLYVSSAYQVANNIVTKYYPGGAFRVGTTLYYLLSDHLGSTSITTSASGAKLSEMRYTAWGGIRYASGSALTDKTFTGQRSYVGDFGLMYYNARWYDGGLGRFAQADTLVPNSIQGLDHYIYGNNNPIKYTDPSGHDACSSVPLGYREDCYRSIGYNDLADEVIQQINNLILAIAKAKNIQLSPNDHWEYSNDLYDFSFR